MLEKVKDQPYVTFVGVPGSGKTATAHHIALMLQHEEYEIVPIKDIRKIEDYCDPWNPQVFVIDDVIGVFGLQETKLNLLSDYQDRIMKPIMPKSKTLMTCREAVYRKTIQSSSLFTDENNIVLLHNEANALTNTDKINILKMYNIDVNLLSPTNLKSASKMFPYLCKLFSTEKKFQLYGSLFFENPVPCILKELEEMEKRNKIHYVSLVLCMMNENKISEKTLEETENETVTKDVNQMKQCVLRKCKISSQVDNFRFVASLSEMEGTYTKLCGTEYTFVHDSMCEIVAYHFGARFPELILQFMSCNYIANYVKLHKCHTKRLDDEIRQASENSALTCKNQQEKENDTVGCESKQKEENFAGSSKNCDRMESFDLSLRLREEQFPMLAERLYRDIENMELYDVFMNDILKQSKVCKAFIKVLMRKSYTELKSLFLSVQNNVSKIVQKRERVRRESMERGQWSREWLRQRVLVNERWMPEHTYRVRVISWVVSYGHHQILQYILQKTELNKETQSVLFGNCFNPYLSYIREEEKDSPHIPEQYRLLLLSCYSGDLETVKILLKYINRDTMKKKLTYFSFDHMLYNTPLTVACMDGHINIVKELIEVGADVNPKGKFDTPLKRACEGGHLTVVKELLEAGAHIDTQDSVGRTPLYVAILKDIETLIPVVRILNKYGADSSICNKEGLSPFYIALVNNKSDVVTQLLGTENESQLNRLKLHFFDCLVNIRHSDVMTDCKDDVVVTQKQVWRMEERGDLHITIRSIKSDVLKHLLRLGLDVNQWIQLYGNNDFGWYESEVRPLLFTLIDECTVMEKVEKVKILLEAGVDVNVRVRYRDSVLDREGVCVLERTRQLVSKFKKSKSFWEKYKMSEYKRVLGEIKKYVRRYSL